MQLSRIQKTILTITLISGALWLGGYVSRILIGFQFFQERDFLLKNIFVSSNLETVFFSQNPVLTLVLIAYPIFIVSFFVFLFISKISLKKNGWLFIITIIVILTAPFEIYLLTIDYKIFTFVNNGNFDPNELLRLTIKRFKVLSSFPIIEIASYFAIIYLMIAKPFTKKSDEN